MKAIGYQPIALETDHLHTSLAAGMIDAAPVTPIFALGAQVHTVAPHMLELNWVPIVGAIIVRSEVWASIPAPVRAKLQALHEEAGRQLRDEGRRFHDEAVKTLRRGPKTQVHSPSPAQRLEWQKLAEELGPQVRDRIVPAATYDRVQALLAEYRAGKS
jgi:TRAP-type C4-dicarboxylate transport system substrate-binding protein